MPNKTDDLAQAVGSALAVWSRVEIRLAHLFHTLSDIPDYSKAHMLFDSVKSFDTRLALCNALMGNEKLSHIDIRIWKRFRSRVLTSYKKRHEIAHFSFSTYTDLNGQQITALSPFFSIGRFNRGETTYLDVSDIEARARDFAELVDAVLWFWSEAIKRRGRWEGSDETLENELIIRLRNEAHQGSKVTIPGKSE